MRAKESRTGNLRTKRTAWSAEKEGNFERSLSRLAITRAEGKFGEGALEEKTLHVVRQTVADLNVGIELGRRARESHALIELRD